MKFPLRLANGFVLAILALLAPDPLFADNPDWQTDWTAAFEQARAEQKPVFINFYAEWCGPCRAMRRTTLRDPRVTEQLANFVLLSVDVGKRQVAETYGVPGVPWYSVRDPWEREVVSILGYREARTFAPQLAGVANARAAIIETGATLQRGDSAEAWRQRGSLAQSLGEEASARSAYLKAAAAAAARGDADLESVLKIEAALSLVRGDRQLIGKGIGELEAMLDAYTSPEVLAATWLALGFAEEQRKKTKAAREAYQRGLEIAPEGTAVARQLASKLEGMKTKRR